MFWLFVAVDLAGIGLFYLLGLAAAGSSRTSPLSVTLLMFVLPALLLAVSVVLFTRGTSTAIRTLAFALAAAPLVILVSTSAAAKRQFRANSNAEGELTFFTAGKMRDIVEAIRRNDTATVSALLPTVDVNQTGMEGMTLLILALRQLRSTPAQQSVLKLLLDAGADPNKSAGFEMPLQMALQTSSKTGAEPVRLLLAAGADPNARSPVSDAPVFFSGVGGKGSEMMELLSTHGADVTRTGNNGETLLFSAANARNWKLVLFLLQGGADWRQGRTLSGQSFEDMLAANESWASADSGYAEVVNFLKQR